MNWKETISSNLICSFFNYLLFSSLGCGLPTAHTTLALVRIQYCYLRGYLLLSDSYKIIILHNLLYTCFGHYFTNKKIKNYEVATTPIHSEYIITLHTLNFDLYNRGGHWKTTCTKYTKEEGIVNKPLASDEGDILFRHGNSYNSSSYISRSSST